MDSRVGKQLTKKKMINALTMRRKRQQLVEFSTHISLLAVQLLMIVLDQQKLQVESAPNNSRQTNTYYGSLIGKLNRRDHNVSGEVYAVDEQTLFIKNFNYDGLAPDAYFWSSTTSGQPSSVDGFIVPDEKGSTKPLERYVDKDVVLRLPEGKTLREINWLSIWSRQTKQNSGEIMIGPNLITPRPLEIGAFSQLAHGVKSGPITIVDAQTFLVSDFHYDGLGPAGYFWLTRGTQGLSANGLRLKDENGSANPLRKYSGETVVISLPDDLTIYDFDYFGVWCKEFQVNFGQTRIPQTAKVPPSPKMLGIKPENKLNCEILYDDLGYEIRWVLDGDDIVMQLVGKIEPGEYMAFGLGKDDSKSDMNNADAVVTWVDRSSGQVHAVDYFLGAKQQCVNDPQGSCPDVKLQGGGDSLTLLHGAIVNGYSMVTFKRPQLGIDELYDQHVYSDGQQSVLWAIGTLNAQKEIGYHRLKTRTNMFIDFARNPQWNCPIPDLNASMHNNLPMTSASQVDPVTIVSAATGATEQATNEGGLLRQSPTQPQVSHKLNGQDQHHHHHLTRPVPLPAAGTSSSSSRVVAAEPNDNQMDGHTHLSGGEPLSNRSADHNDPWYIPSIVCPNERTFYAQIGPTAGHKGYEGLTGRTSWGVSWYINGLMIPELVLERGQTYRFVVEGGSDKTSAARRHPFYLTDSAEGGFDFKTDEERLKERIFAGVALRGDGQFVPTAEGRLCEWKQTNATLSNPDLYPTFSAYQRSLKLDCLAGQASMLKFAPDSSTPNVIYYQCYTHRYMGWRIRVVNSCSSYLNSLNSGVNNNNRASSGSSQVLVQGNNTNNHMKRDLNELSIGNEKSTYNRRYSLANADELSTMSNSEPRMMMSFQDYQNQNLPETNFVAGADFGDDSSASSSFTTEMSMLTNPTLSSLSANEMLNNSHRQQQQQQQPPIVAPFNWTTLEEILKLSSADLEFMDNQGAQDDTMPLEPFLSTGFTSMPLPLHNFTSHQSAEAKHQNNNNKTSSGTKTPKTLHSYMRRLASIYYPVQQQLASILASQSASSSTTPPTPTQAASSLSSSTVASPSSSSSGTPSTGSTQIQSAPTEQVATFSLSNLVPKSKIDLSKSTISKKLNKLRFKSGRKYEPKLSQPPTPNNQFNYDIFNNQLAQLEKQQKQFQSIESQLASNWPPPQTSNSQLNQQQQTDAAASFNYLPMVTAPSDEQQVIDSMNLQSSQMLLGSVFSNSQQPPPPLPQQQQQQPFANNMQLLKQQPQMAISSNTYQQQAQRFRQPPPPSHLNNGGFRQPPRLSEMPLGPPNQLGQQPYVLDYLSMVLNNNRSQLTEYPSSSQPVKFSQEPINSNWLNNQFSQYPTADNRPQPQLQQRPRQQQQQQQPQQQPYNSQQQPAVYITRLSPQQSYPNNLYAKPQQQQQDNMQLVWPNSGNSGSARYPSIQPYATYQSPKPHQAPLQSSTYRDSPEQQQQQYNGNYMSSMPSVSLTIHDTHDPILGNSVYPSSMMANNQASGNQEVESLSGSGSGSYYDFRQQPVVSQSQQFAKGSGHPSPDQGQTTGGGQSPSSSADLTDHMIAIERFSKQSSERRPPSIVHPVTGEQVNLAENGIMTMGSNDGEQQQQQQQQQPTQSTPMKDPSTRQYSMMLIDKNMIGTSSEPTPIQANDILEMDQTVQMVHSNTDLQRLNAPVNDSRTHNTIVLMGDDPSADKIHQRTGTFVNNTNTNTSSFQQQQQADNGCSQMMDTTTSGTKPAQNCQRQTTTESIPPVLVEPNNFDNIHRDSLATTTVSSTTAGPLTPSLGPPTQPGSGGTSTVGSVATGSSGRANYAPDDGQVIFKSTLIDPVTSQNNLPNTFNNKNNHNHFVSRLNFDMSPFTPIELTNPLVNGGYYANNHYYQQQQQQTAASNLLTSRLRPSPLIESMISQHQSPFRPEPPVQVASYLAHHLISHNPMFVSSERSVASNQPMAMSVSIPSNDASNGPSTSEGGGGGAAAAAGTRTTTITNGTSNGMRPTAFNSNELIILKPAILTKQAPQTYLLKPEYMTNQFRPINDNSILANGDGQNDIYYSNNDINEHSRRLAGHQFERLSSLSSPPSTSIALDPMQATNTITLSSYIKHAASGGAVIANSTTTGGQQTTEPNNAKIVVGRQPDQKVDSQQANQQLLYSTTSKNIITLPKENSTTIELSTDNNKLAQHRQTYMPSKPIPLNYELSPSSSASTSSTNADGVRLNPGGDNINTLLRDNNTDNAILSHVMSLISSNAIPTPPIIPVASYSSADYFLPISDRTHRSIRG